MPDHNTHGVGFKRMRMAGLLPAAALILAVFAPSTVSVSDAQPRMLRMSKFPAASSPVSISIKSKALITAISKWAVRVNCLMIRI